MKKIDMQDALNLLNIAYPSGKSSFYIECPFCKGYHKSKRKTMNINLAKGDGGVFSCLRCNLQGHTITFWREYKGFSNNKEAAKDIQKTLKGDGASSKKRHKKITHYQEPKISSIETRNKTYNELLNMLVLTDNHRKSLIERGINNSYIDWKQYKSIPQTGHDEIATVLLDKGLLLDGVPGFFKRGDTWSFVKTGSGILIPQRDSFGRIQGFQIRMDNTRSGKYINLTSNNYPSGTPSKTFVHLAPSQTMSDEVIITEGALKADVVAFLSGKTVLSIPGVNSTRYLPKALDSLKKRGVKKIGIAFDMDLWDNPHVYNALCKLVNLIRDADIPFYKMEWDHNYKGLDDYLKEKIYKDM